MQKEGMGPELPWSESSLKGRLLLIYCFNILGMQQGVTTRVTQEANTPQMNLDVNSRQTSVPWFFWRLFSPPLNLMCQMLVLILFPTQAACVRISPVAEMLCSTAFHSWSPLGDVAFRLATVVSRLYLLGSLILFFFVCTFCQVRPRFVTVYCVTFKFPLKLELDLCAEESPGHQDPRALGDTRIVAQP